MKYDVDLFVRIINFIVSHGDEPELYIELKNNTYVNFTCYEDFIEAIVIVGDCDSFFHTNSQIEIQEKTKIFSNINDMLDNLIINGKSLRSQWNEVKYIDDDCVIDYTKEPEEQYIVIDGRICYTPIR